MSRPDFTLEEPLEVQIRSRPPSVTDHPLVSGTNSAFFDRMADKDAMELASRVTVTTLVCGTIVVASVLFVITLALLLPR